MRVKWAPGTVVAWDVSCIFNVLSNTQLTDREQNRVTAHSATLDWSNGQRRHLARITPQAERPYETPFEANPADGSN